MVRTQERHRTIRIAIVGGYIFAGFGIAVWAVTAILLHDENPWVKVVELLAAILAPVAVPSIPLFRAWKKIRIYFASHANRSQRLELEIDQYRESSDLNRDGSSSYDP